jgi:hypothetical protein
VSKIIEDVYLGDGVYASYDGEYLWLDTRAQHPIHRIGLDPMVLKNLDTYLRAIRVAIQESASEDEAPASGA